MKVFLLVIAHIFAFSGSMASPQCDLDEPMTDLYFQTSLLEKSTYIDKIHEDYFELNKKYISESKDNTQKIKTLEEDNAAVFSISLELEQENKKLKDQVEQLQKEKDSYQQEKDDYAFELQKIRTLLNEETKRSFHEYQEIIKERNWSVDQLENLKKAYHVLGEQKNETELKLNEITKKINGYDWHEFYLNTTRLKRHLFISTTTMAQQKWLLTQEQVYILTHLCDNGTIVIEKKQ